MTEWSRNEVVVIRLSTPHLKSVSVLVRPDGSVYRPLLGYLLTPRMASTSSTHQEQTVQAVRLALDFLDSSGSPSRTSRQSVAWRALEAHLHEEGGKTRNQISAILKHVSSFVSWLSDEYPKQEENPFSRLGEELRAESTSDSLPRTHPNRVATKARSRYPRITCRTKHFPEDAIWSMIFDGCRRDRRTTENPIYTKQYNVRNQLAYLLLFFGGVRISNLMHIFASDLEARRGGLIDVRLAHPSESQGILGGQDRRKRKQYLAEEYGLLPRNELHKKDPRWSGWKNLLLEFGPPHYFSYVYWINPLAQRLFTALIPVYLSEIISIPRNHPYLFINTHSEQIGSPWKRKQCASAFRSSVERVGLKAGMSNGTHVHGARHFYGQKAQELGIDPRIRQVMMHHRSIYSQGRYQIPTSNEINKAIQQATPSEVPRSGASQIIEEILGGARWNERSA